MALGEVLLDDLSERRKSWFFVVEGSVVVEVAECRNSVRIEPSVEPMGDVVDRQCSSQIDAGYGIGRARAVMIHARESNRMPEPVSCAARSARSRVRAVSAAVASKRSRRSRACRKRRVLTSAVATSGPDQQDEPGSWAERPPDVRERGNGIGEEHRPEPAEAELESWPRERVSLGVPDPVRDIAQTLRIAEPPSTLEHLGGDVDAHHASVARCAGGLACGLTGPASDVEHVILWTHGGGSAEVRVVAMQFGVVEVGVVGRGHAQFADVP